MEILKHSVGIDIDKKTFKACICLIDNSLQTKAVASKTFDNTDSGFRLFEDWSQKYCMRNPSPVSYVMEATGVYHESLSWHLHGKGLPVSIVLPTKAKNYMKSLGQHTKNDPMDAKGLAMMGAQQHLEIWSPPSMELYSLKRLTRHYEALQQERTRLLGRMESASHIA